jgi:tetratricopeptide (TPR) repeat protein
MGLAITSIRLKDYETADPLTEKILSDFVGDDRLSQAACLIADAYRSTRHHNQATDLYQYVIDNHPDSEYAMWSQMGIAISNIDLRNNDAAESAIAKLLADYAEHPSFHQAVRDIGDNYRWRDVHDKAHKMYELASKGVAPSEAFWVKMGLAVTSVHLGDYEIADSLTEQLLTQFGSHDQLPEAICLIGGAYRSVGEYDKALSLYQTILELWPASEQALWTKAGMAGIDIASADQAAAAKTIDNLVADFNDHPVLPQAVLAIGEEYYMDALRKEKAGLVAEARDRLTKAIGMWERLIAELPEIPHATAQAHYFLGACYRQLGEYAKAVQHYEKVVGDWPDCDFAGQAQFMVGRIYEYLRRSGTIPKTEEADSVIKAAYEAVLLYYSDCRAARAARNRLNAYECRTETRQPQAPPSRNVRRNEGEEK